MPTKYTATITLETTDSPDTEHAPPFEPSTLAGWLESCNCDGGYGDTIKISAREGDIKPEAHSTLAHEDATGGGGQCVHTWADDFGFAADDEVDYDTAQASGIHRDGTTTGRLADGRRALVDEQYRPIWIAAAPRFIEHKITVEVTIQMPAGRDLLDASLIGAVEYGCCEELTPNYVSAEVMSHSSHPAPESR